jgi:UDP-N-acetylmuramoyl-L-alanyl-D-glutamate--2,6-diaminopimelate ligase
MNIQQLIISNIDFVEISGETDAVFDNICYDSRKFNDKSVFVAMRGFYTDGHNFIKDVLEKGVQAVICEEIPEFAGEYGEVAFVKVKDARVALAQLSHSWFDFPSDKMKIIGVTGTNGKTTIAFIINSILKEAGYKTGVIGTTGIFINEKKLETNHTTPESLELAEIFSKMLKEGVEYVVMEVSSHALIQKRVHGINFEAAVFSNLTHEHLDFHKNMDNYASAKKILFDSLNQESFAVINADSDYADFIIKDCEAPKYKVSQLRDADFSVSSVVLGMNKSTYDILWRRNNDEIIVNIQTLLPGKFNVENISLAVSTALLLGIDPAAIESGIHKTKGAPGRMQKVVLKNGAMGIIDYAHTPDALEKVLFALKAILNEQEFKDNNLICVFGCGGDRDSAKRPQMGKVASEIADIAIITDDNPRTENPVDIINDIVNGVPESKRNKIQIINSRSKAIKYAYSISKNNDVIIIAGKGHETYQIIGVEKLHFDDKEELLKAESESDKQQT